VLGCAIFLFLETFVLPLTPRVAGGDQSIYLHDAARMFDGEVIYRDFDHFTFPGTSAIYCGLFRWFGVRAWIPQAMLILIGTLIAWLSFGVCRKVMSGPLIFLPGILFVVLPFTGYLDATHHWYSTLAATGALAVVMQERTRSRVATAGVLWGLGTWFAQSMVLGPVGLVLFLIWEARRAKASPSQPSAWKSALGKKISIVLGCYLATVVTFNAYFVARVGLGKFFYNTFVFVAKYYPKDSFNTWGSYLSSHPPIQTWATSWHDLPAWMLTTVLLPLIYILFFVRYRHEARLKPDVPWERLMLVNVTGLSMLLTVASAAAYNRLYTVVLPGLILLVWFLDTELKVERVLLRGVWGMVLLLAVVKPAITQTRWRRVLNLPTGRAVFFTPAAYDKTAWLLERTRPSEYFFGDQFDGFVLRLRDPGPVAFVRPTGYTRPEEVRALVQGLEEHQVEFVSWYAGLDDEVVDSMGDNLGPLREELRKHYRVAATFANDDKIWERRR
jgi:hypothetical protein